MVQPLSTLPRLLPRPYSISSSPLSPLGPSTLTLTYAVHRSPPLPNLRGPIHQGVASTYLAQLTPGDRIHCSVRPCTNNFRLPADPRVPVIMIATGTGIAPFRAFIQQRAALLAAAAGGLEGAAEQEGGKGAGRMLLYYGCRDPESDFLYAGELARWEELGVVDVRACFSRRRERSGGYGYVTERLWGERGELRGWWEGGAVVFLCGGRGVVEGVAGVGERIWGEGREGGGEDGGEEGVERGREWVEGWRGVRFFTDVFG